MVVVTVQGAPQVTKMNVVDCGTITSAVYAYKAQPQPQTSTELWEPNSNPDRHLPCRKVPITE